MKDTSTRSGLLWEVERILKECEIKPTVLIMENVAQVHSVANNDDFLAWQRSLENMGYTNYWQDMSATDYGIPQTRVRTFMVSIYGEYNYTFPKPMKLKLKLKDLLESNVSDKYNLTIQQIQQIQQWNSYQNPLDSVMGKDSICSTITTRIAESQDGGINASMKVFCDSFDNNTNIRIKNATKKGYLEASDGDGIDISSRMESHRGTVQKGKSQTLTTMGGENVGVIEKVNVPNEVKVVGNYSPSGHNASRIISSGGGSSYCDGKSWDSDCDS